MTRSPRLIGVALAMTVTVGLLGGCQTARVGAKCRTTALGHDATHVLRCVKGRWQRAMTIAQAVAFVRALAAKNTTTTTTPTPDIAAAPQTADAAPGAPATSAPPPTTSTTTTVPPTPKSVDLKLLVIAADGNETDYPAIKAFLDQQGMPYTTLLAKSTPLTAAMLQSSPTHGLYDGIVLTTGNLIYPLAGGGTAGAFTSDEWNVLHTYQSAFGVRSVTSFTLPELAYGLDPAGEQDTLVNPLSASLTTAGQAVFTDIKPNASIPLSGAWTYFGTVHNPAVTTPLVTTTVGGHTYPVASVTQYPGYQNMAITIANNPNLTHSLLFAPGWINWVTKGVSLGSRHANIDVQIDDLFLADDTWNPTANDATGPEYRNAPADLDGLAAWQNARHAKPTTPNIKAEFPFVGAEANGRNDPLVVAARNHKNDFGYLNHTSTHFNLDCGDCPDPNGIISTTASQIQAAILDNLTDTATLGLPTPADQMVQPDISGINTPNNPMAQKAAADVGIRYWISDTSRAGQDNPSFNTGFYAPGDSRLFIVPRRPSNLFYSVSTPDEWVSVYNWFYAPGGQLCAITTCFSAPQTYAQILDYESSYFLTFLLQGDNDPWMFHTPNIKLYDGVHSVLSDLLDATLAKYDAVSDVPIRSLTFGQAGADQQARGLYNASGVTATEIPCQSLTLTAAHAAVIPVTGVAYTAPNSTVESYASQTISNITMTAGQTLTIPLPAC